MMTLFMAFIVAIVTWAGNIAIAYVRALLFLPVLVHQLHAQSKSAWCFLRILPRGSCLITRNKCSANHSKTRFILLFC
jgi:hypothetical protein